MTNLGRTLWMIARAVRGGSCPEAGPCETPFRVLPTDLDFLLHMNNAVYFQVMDVARVDWLVRSKVWQRLRKKKLHLVVSDETIQFRKSLMLGHSFTIETRVVGWDEKAFFVEQRFVRKGELWANALLRLRALDARHKPVPTSEVLPVLDAGHVASPPLPDWVTSWMQTQGALRTTMRPAHAA